MVKSKYLEAFKKLDKELGKAHKLCGDNIYVEELPVQELKTKSGLIIANTHNARDIEAISYDTPTFVRVLSVGAGYYDEEGTDVPVAVEPGNVVMAAALSVKWLNSFGGMVLKKPHRIGLMSEDAILEIYEGDEAYEKAVEIIRSFSELGETEQVSEQVTAASE